MVALAERTDSVKKLTDAWIRCAICLYGNNFVVEIKQSEDGKYFYAEKCPKCSHYEDIHEITPREAKRYIVFEDLI